VKHKKKNRKYLSISNRYCVAANMNSSALRALALEYKSLLEEPVEGFRVKLLNDDNLFEWSVILAISLNQEKNNNFFISELFQVGIYGPPETLYQGGYFKVNCLKLIEFFAQIT
jgi:ubiquitin-conjugating enzyme E2 R